MKISILIVWIMLITGAIALFICINQFRYRIFPPSDLYTPLAIRAVDFNGLGREYIFSFENKYSGTHMIALVVDDPPPVGQDYEIDQLKFSVLVRDDKNIIMEKIIDQYVYPFWGHGGRYSGISLMNYEVPDDLPKNEILEIKISVLKGIGELEKKYKSVHFLIAKISDK